MSASLMQALPAIARSEWRAMLRNQVAVAAGILMLALTLAAILVSHERMQAVNAERERFQSTADEQWHNQPDRHPHRVVHSGSASRAGWRRAPARRAAARRSCWPAWSA